MPEGSRSSATTWQRDRSAAMRQFGAVLEGARTIYWRLSAMENLMYFGRLKGVHGKYLKPRAERLLKELDLWDRRNDDVREFSRGMQQKVAISAALMSDPPIVLLDEPTLGLDVESGPNRPRMGISPCQGGRTRPSCSPRISWLWPKSSATA